MFSWLGTLFILTVIFYAFYIPLKKLYYALSPKKRAIHEAGEEWHRLADISGRKRNEMMDLNSQINTYLYRMNELDRENFDTEEAYEIEKKRLRMKYEEAKKEREKVENEWKKASDNEHEALTKLADMCGKEEHK